MRKFLASVGNAKLLGKKKNQIVHIADVRTLTESTLSFSNTQEEVRAGEGAQLYGRFSHDSGMTVTLTDAMFNLDYIALQVGSEITHNATAFYGDDIAIEGPYTAPVTNAVTLSRPAKPIGNACGLNHVVAWVRQKGCDANTEWKAVIIENNQISAADMAKLTEDATAENPLSFCLQYFVDKPEALMASVSSNFIPAELILILTTKLFAGDASAPETGKPVGEITVKIPRFSLDGTFDLSMAMSSAATISLSGTALAVDDGSCEGKGIYAEIVETKYDSSVMDGLKDMIIDAEFLSVDTVPSVYAMYADGSISELSTEFFTVATAANGVNADDKLVVGTNYITASTNGNVFSRNGTSALYMDGSEEKNYTGKDYRIESVVIS